MYVCVTEKKTGTSMVFNTACILFVKKDTESGLVTRVLTNIMGPQGLQSFQVEEDVEEVGRRILEAQNLGMQTPHKIEPEKYGFGQCRQRLPGDTPLDGSRIIS